MSFEQQTQYIVTLTTISLRARLLWLLMGTSCQPGSNKLWIKQATFGLLLGCSRSSIGRALQELIKANLIIDLNKRHLGRFKTYSLPGLIPAETKPLPIETMPIPTSPLAPLQNLERGINPKSSKQAAVTMHQRICTPIQNEQLNPRAKEFLNIWGKVWKEQFPKLDGSAGRPFLEACVEEATSEIQKLGIHRDLPG
ncbi:MAG: helix-turn-helix domain-containing protein, partial [Myxococcaceae bacterium]